MLTGKTALVTGGAKGIGRSIALKIAQAHGNVAIMYRGSQKNAEQTIDELQALGIQAKSYQCDVADFNATKELVTQVIKDFGGLDILVNNAGINKDQLMIRISDDEWYQLIHTNLDSAFYCSRAVLRPMMKKRYGRIINISSVVGMNGNAGQAHYAAAKSGLLGFTFSLAQEYGNRGITANVVAPGFIQSDMTAALSPEQSAKIQAGIAVGRLGNPEDVAAVAAFLASPRAGYISGQVIKVDGGMSSL